MTHLQDFFYCPDNKLSKRTLLKETEIAMYNLSSRFFSSGKGDKKGPDRLALCIVLQYAASLRIVKNMPPRLASLLIN